ncbi:hypothetical protein [Streptomyces peucetius]|uniref:Uncharacterized protein n=1 Tax=Streptomyces peucetius TaxID=1950 RepID=A0ABY6I7Q7_STRPE|nr:hypothetical protein [Streptomyces peucetius]UYQ63027.1 hypothetical protein OGH68_17050 [Streptomyces peucetius]
MRTKLTTVVSLVAAGAFVCVLAGPAQAATADSGWQSAGPVSTSAAPATDAPLDTEDNNGNS